MDHWELVKVKPIHMVNVEETLTDNMQHNLNVVRNKVATLQPPLDLKISLQSLADSRIFSH